MKFSGFQKRFTPKPNSLPRMIRYPRQILGFWPDCDHPGQRWATLYRGLWVSLSNPPSLAPGLLGHSANGVCSSLAPRVRQTFFLHQIAKEPTNCVVWQRFIRIQSQPMKSEFDRLFSNPYYYTCHYGLW